MNLFTAEGEKKTGGLNLIAIGSFQSAAMDGFIATSNFAFAALAEYEGGGSWFGTKQVLFGELKAPVKGELYGVTRVYSGDDISPSLSGSDYIGARLRINTTEPAKSDEIVELTLLLEGEPLDSGGATYLYEGKYNLTPNTDEFVYFKVSDWIASGKIKRISLLLSPETPCEIYIHTIVSGTISRTSVIQTIIIVISAIIGLAVLAFVALVIRAKIITMQVRKRREERRRRQIDKTR
ncbi:hypothetical protein FACS1894105_14320 [Clostridia bacterium]|nr:hypothetical protein FACS1894105_14320 [Clostridia bacterium]